MNSSTQLKHVLNKFLIVLHGEQQNSIGLLTIPMINLRDVCTKLNVHVHITCEEVHFANAGKMGCD